MEKRLIVSNPQQNGWLQRIPSAVKRATLSGSIGKPLAQDALQTSAGQFENTTLLVSVSMPAGVACYTVYEVLGSFVSTWVQTPLDIVATSVKIGFRFIADLPLALNLTIFFLLTSVGLYHGMLLVLRRYQAFLELGRGGTPQTPSDWIKCSMLAAFAQVDCLSPPCFDPVTQPGGGRLAGLEFRKGRRPTVRGVAPQRQLDGMIHPKATFSRLSRMLKAMAKEDNSLKIANSYLEGNVGCLMATFPDRRRKVLGTDSEWDFEIAHPHKIDGSFHVVMHPEDVCALIEHGWGERHLLATGSWWWKVFFHRVLGQRRPTPYNLILIYAPRNDHEFAMAQRILNAAVDYHKEIDLCGRNAEALRQSKTNNNFN